MGVCRLEAMSRYGESEPAHNEDSSISVVLDGEIFNYDELKVMLSERGHRFRTKSSEELLAHLYEEFGPDCALQLNGLYAFAVWDQVRHRLVLVRDRVGVKPLHYAVDSRKGELIFASEIKAILQGGEIQPKVNICALRDYLSYWFVPAPETMFDGIMKLPAGHYLVFDGRNSDLVEYWDLNSLNSQGMNVRREYSRLDYLLRQSVRRRISDQEPVGVFLSGGIDSSIIAGLASQLVGGDRVKTFSVGCEESSYSELEDARYVAEHFGTDHHEVLIKCDIFNLVRKLVYHTDEPLADWSLFPTYLVSKLAKEHVDTVLSGDAADDLFAGHERLMADRIDTYYSRLPRLVRDGV
jgi:asparagine synthase (glutamine-hydrolysing)